MDLRNVEEKAVSHANSVSQPEFSEWHGRYSSFKRGYRNGYQEAKNEDKAEIERLKRIAFCGYKHETLRICNKCGWSLDENIKYQESKHESDTLSTKKQ